MNPSARRPHRLILIAAVDRHGGIGRNNQLLAHLPEDLQHFRRSTQGCPVLMGRKTWDSLPTAFRPLPGRRNIVLSHQVARDCPGAEVFGALSTALEALADEPTVYVIGGAQIYREALPWATALLLTEIDAVFPADAFFPDWDRSAFLETARQAGQPKDPTLPAYDFVHYHRRSPA